MFNFSFYEIICLRYFIKDMDSDNLYKAQYEYLLQKLNTED